MKLRFLRSYFSKSSSPENALEALREKTQLLLSILAILHVPLIAGAAALLGANTVGLAGLAAVFAIIAIAAQKIGSATMSRAVLLAALQCQVATLLAAFTAAAVAVHHLGFNFLAAGLVYPAGSDLGRTILHAVILIFETTALAFAVLIIQRSLKETEKFVFEANLRTEEAQAAKSEAEKIEKREKFNRNLMLEELEQVFGDVVLSAQKGEFEHRITKSFDEPQFQRLATATNELIGSIQQSVESISLVMSEFSKGNLTARMEGDFGGKFADLQTSIRSTGEQLSHMIADIRTVSLNVANSATDLTNHGHQGIAHADEQSCLIENATNSMTRLANLIKDGADKTEAGEKMSKQTKKLASEGASIVTDAVQAMHKISEGSKQIEEIISVIDGIAFQTNLLALNAAVEAARAGDAGKGFSVVASEVRNLAKRSGDSASEIRNLIATSVDEVAQGVEFVDRTGQALNEITSSVETITEHAETLSEITTRKSELIDEMSNQMTSINNLTEKTADMAQTNGKSGEKLHNESADFLKMLDQFEVHDRSKSSDDKAAA